VGGFRFYNRAEVKDTLAYVRLALHPEDDISLLRVLNVPARGIGKTTVDALRGVAQKEGLSFWDAMESLMTNPESSRAVAPLRAFRELIQRLQEGYSTKEPADYLRYVLDETGYMSALKDRNTPEDVARIENLEELTRAVAEAMDAGESFTEFLDAAALVSDADYDRLFRRLVELEKEPIDWELKDEPPRKGKLQRPDLGRGNVLPNITGADLGGLKKQGTSPNVYTSLVF